MARQRIVAGVAATLTWQAVDQNGEPTDPGTTTVGVVDSTGTTVLAAGTATTTSGTARTVAIAAQDIDTLTVTWTGATATGTTYVDVVGGVYFTVAALRAAHPTMADTTTYPTASIQTARAVVETVFERSVGYPFVPRLATVQVSDGFAQVRGVKRVRWAQSATHSPWVYEEDTADLALSTRIIPDGVICSSNYRQLGVVCGYDQPPPDIYRHAMNYCKHLLTEATAGIDMRVMAMQDIDGAQLHLATPGLSVWVTGIPTIDEALKDYRLRHQRTPRPIRAGAWFA